MGDLLTDPSSIGNPIFKGTGLSKVMRNVSAPESAMEKVATGEDGAAWQCLPKLVSNSWKK